MKITNQNQFEALVSQMEKNPSLAKGFYKGQVLLNYKEEWEIISRKLNSLGPPIRDSSGWQKVWKDLKFKVKKKLLHNKTEAMATGGGVFKQMPLSPLEESAANLLQFHKLLNPQEICLGSGELGEECVVENVEIRPLEQTETCAPTTSDNIPCSTKKKQQKFKSTSKQEIIELVQKQGENSGEMLKTLRSIENHLKDSAYYQRKMYHVSEDLVKVLKRQAEREEESFELDQQYKKKKLELLQTQLDAMK